MGEEDREDSGNRWNTYQMVVKMTGEKGVESRFEWFGGCTGP